MATVLTPNQFECELLTGIPIKAARDVAATFAHFHARGVRTVFITSLEGVVDGPFAAVVGVGGASGTAPATRAGASGDSGGDSGGGTATDEFLFIVASHAAAGGGGGGGDGVEDGVTATAAALPPPQQLFVAVPRIPAYFTGAGDLTAALLLAWLHKTNGDLAGALERTCATIQVGNRARD